MEKAVIYYQLILLKQKNPPSGGSEHTPLPLVGLLFIQFMPWANNTLFS
ncbi:MAG: hypothetical protein RSF13_00420 [Clostridiales bacterium]